MSFHLAPFIQFHALLVNLHVAIPLCAFSLFHVINASSLSALCLHLTMNRLSTFSLLLLLLPLLISAQCTCESDPEEQSSRTGATRYKLAAIFSILAASLIGVALPTLGKKIPALRPENDVFFAVKAFAAGVILATGFIHVLPDAFESLTSPCLGESPWGSFPFSGFVAMLSAIGTMMMDAFATGFYQRLQRSKAQPVKEDEEMQCENQDQVHGHPHGSGFVSGELGSPELARHRVIAQVGWLVPFSLSFIFLLIFFFFFFSPLMIFIIKKIKLKLYIS